MRSFQLSPRTMATMAMPVLGASAVSARVSVRAKRSFVGARTQGVTRKAHRPAAATRVAASAHSVDRVDDLHLGQVRRVFHLTSSRSISMRSSIRFPVCSPGARRAWGGFALVRFSKGWCA